MQLHNADTVFMHRKSMLSAHTHKKKIQPELKIKETNNSFCAILQCESMSIFTNIQFQRQYFTTPIREKKHTHSPVPVSHAYLISNQLRTAH